MARIEGVDLPKRKRVEIGLTYIFGIGRSASSKILKKAGVDPNTKTDELSESDEIKIRKIITDEHKVEGELRSEASMNIIWDAIEVSVIENHFLYMGSVRVPMHAHVRGLEGLQ